MKFLRDEVIEKLKKASVPMNVSSELEPIKTHLNNHTETINELDAQISHLYGELRKESERRIAITLNFNAEIVRLTNRLHIVMAIAASCTLGLILRIFGIL